MNRPCDSLNAEVLGADCRPYSTVTDFARLRGWSSADHTSDFGASGGAMRAIVWASSGTDAVAAVQPASRST